MSQENVALVQELIDARERGDLDGLMATLDPAVEWTPVESDQSYAVRRGHEEVRAWLAEGPDALANTHWVVEEVRDAGGEIVVALVRRAAREATGVPEVATPANSVLFTIRAGKIVRISEYADPGRAFEAAGVRR